MLIFCEKCYKTLEYSHLPFQKVVMGSILTRWRKVPKGRCGAYLNIAIQPIDI